MIRKQSKAFKALWMGEIVSELGGAAGGIINGLLLYELTGSKQWMALLWIVYFIPSLMFQLISSPLLNNVAKEQVLCHIQLLRALTYMLPFCCFLFDSTKWLIGSLILLQCVLGLLLPIYASLSFAILPVICEQEKLIEANGLLDGTLRLMSFLAPGTVALLLIAIPLPFLYIASAILFLLSYSALLKLPSSTSQAKKRWSMSSWWRELKEGFQTFFQIRRLVHLTILSSSVQFAVGATLVLSVPFIRGELQGDTWQYAFFTSAFPIGYVLGTLLLSQIPKNTVTMYIGVIGGGLSFMLLTFVPSISLAIMCEIFGGLIFPLFNAQNAALFQRYAPAERLPQLSAVRLLLFRITMPIGIGFASLNILSLRQMYFFVGCSIICTAFYILTQQIKRTRNY